MKYTCSLCYPQMRKYLSSIQEGHDHAREHFDRMRVDNDKLTEERVHQMCFPRPRLWVEPRPIETIDIDLDEPSTSAADHDVRESVEDNTNNSETRLATGWSAAKAEFVRKRTDICARIKKYVRNNKLECRVCRKEFVVIHPSTGFQGQSASRHSETHLGIRYWKCAFCPKDYYCRGNLHSHLANRHKDQQRGDPDGGKIDESLQYSEQVLDMLSKCFDYGRPECSGIGEEQGQ